MTREQRDPELCFPLFTERLVLDMPDASSAKAVSDYYARNREHHAPWDPPRPKGFYSADYWRRQLERNRSDFACDRAMRLFLRLKDAPLIIGATNFSSVHRGPLQACILGYHVDASHEGQGYMREALERAIDYVFDTLHIHRISANYLPTNERSGGLLRRLGFAVEGYARDYLFINGAWRDHILTALTNPREILP